MRYEHFLFRTRPGSWPRSVLLLTVDLQWSRSSGNSHKENCTLTRWHTVLVSGRGGNYTSAISDGGTDARSLWQYVRAILYQTRGVYIIAGNSRQALSALGVWDAIDEGALFPAGDDPQAERVSASGSRNLRPPLMILCDPPIVMQLQMRGHKGKITWCDAANYGVQLDWSGENGEKNASQLAAWFRRAAETLQALGPCGWCLTNASQAMHLYRSAYLETPILSHTDRRATALETAGIYGGRNEVLQLGRIAGPIYVYDFRSLYPYLLQSLHVPVRLARVGVGLSVVELARLQAAEHPGTVGTVGDARYGLPDESPSIYTIAECQIETEQPWYPWKRDKELHFPVGRFTTTLGGEELSLAMRSGHVRGVRRYAVYESAPAFASYATALLSHRQSAISRGDTQLASWLKGLMVSLWGKFAQRDKRWVTRRGADPLYQWGQWYRKLEGHGSCLWRSIGGTVQVQLEGEYVSGSVPAITAAVAAAGRGRLLRAVLCCGWENTYYMDTDSIVTDEAGREALVQYGWVRDNEPGYLRLQCKADVAEIYGLKHYTIGELKRYSGMPGGGAKFFETGSPQPMTPGITEQLTRKQRPANWREAVEPARRIGRYTERRGPGGRVKPLEIWEKFDG